MRNQILRWVSLGFGSVLLLMVGAVAPLAAPDDAPATLPVAGLRFEVFKAEAGANTLSRSSILLMWSMGTGVDGLKGGTFAWLEGPTDEYPGWVSPDGRVMSALAGGHFSRNMMGHPMLEFAEVEGAVLYQAKAGEEYLERISGSIVATEVSFEHEGTMHKGKHLVFTGKDCSSESQRLLQLFGVAVRGRAGRVKLFRESGERGRFSCPAMVGLDGRVVNILGDHWSLEIPPVEK